MDISQPIGKMPLKSRPISKPRTRTPDSDLSIEEQVLYMQQKAVVELIIEIMNTSHVVGHDGEQTYYIINLNPGNSDTLASLFSCLEYGDLLDAGEEEHDGCEPDPEDAS